MDRKYLYEVIHVFGIVLTFSALGALNLLVANGATKQTNSQRRLIAATHGVGTFLILLGGFGMLARLGLVSGHAFPLWLWVKIAIWVVVAAAAALPYRRPALARPAFFALPLLAAVAAAMAIFKPFAD